MTRQNDTPGVVHPPLLFAGTIVAGLLLNWAFPLPIFFAPARTAGIVLFVLGLLIGASAFIQMRKARTSPNPYRPTSAVVQSGPFSFTRNPMYVSFCINYIGIAIFANSAWHFFLLPVLVGMISDWVITAEEKYLEGKFGEEYIEYKKRVRRWF